MSILLATVALGSLLGLAIPYHRQKAVPNWPSSITLNTIISILPTLLRAGHLHANADALSPQKWVSFRSERQIHRISLFDRGTRGPLGALVSILHTSTWSTVSILGGVLMVLAVAIGPFGQQLLSFDRCQLPSRSIEASIPRLAHVLYRLYEPGLVFTNRWTTPGSASFVFAGIYAPQANIIPITCTSGNCSLPKHRALG